MDEHHLELPDDILDVISRDTAACSPPIKRQATEGLASAAATKPTRRGGFISPARGDNEEKPPGRGTKGQVLAAEPTMISYPLDSNETCRHCAKSIELDETLRAHFHVNVCSSCRENYGDQYYKLITKTAAREEFLLTEEELGDTVVLPFITKPNPHKATWSDMHLYLLGNVREFAIKKWGSLDALDDELDRRVEAKDTRKERKFKEKLSGTPSPLSARLTFKN